MGRGFANWVDPRSRKELNRFMNVSYTKAKAIRDSAAMIEEEPYLFGIVQENAAAEDYLQSVNDARKLLLTALCVRNIAAGKGGSAAAVKAKLKEYGISLIVEETPLWYQVDGGEIVQEDPRGFVGLILEADIHAQYAQYIRRLAGRESRVTNPRARAFAAMRLKAGRLTIEAKLLDGGEAKRPATVDNMRRCCVCLSDALFDIHLCGLAVRCDNGVETVRSENPLSCYWHIALEEVTKDPDAHSANCEACGRPYFYRSRRTSLYCPSCRNWIGKHKGEKRPYYIDVDNMVGSRRGA